MGKRARTIVMTEGRPAGLILGLFFPLLAGNLCQQFYSFADAVIVGKGIGDEALAAVGTTGPVNFLLLGFLTGLTRGFGIHFAQSFGAGNGKRLVREVRSAVWLCAGTSLLVAELSLLFLREIFAAMGTPEALLPMTCGYFRIILLGIPVTAFNNLCLTLLESLGDGRTPFAAMLLSSAANILLDILLVLVLPFGVYGAAAATVASQLLSIGYCLLFLRRIEGLSGVFARDGGAEHGVWVRMLLTGLPLGLMNSVTALGTMLLQTFVNGMGSVCMTAYAVCVKYQSIFEQFGMSLGMSVLTFVGQNTGAGRMDRVRQGVKAGVLLSVCINAPIAAAEIFFGRQLALFMASAPEVIEQCLVLLPLFGIFMLPLGFLFVFRYACQGLGNTTLPMVSGIYELANRLALGGLLHSTFLGIGIAEVSSWAGAWLILMASYFHLMRKRA